MMFWLFAFKACYTLGSTYNDGAYYILRASDGGYLLVGYTWSASSGSNQDMYIVKLSSSFGLQWTKYIQGSSSEAGYSAVQTSDGGYVVVGNTNSFGAGSSDMLVVKLTSTGSVSWARAIGGSGNDGAGFGNSVIIDNSGNYIIVGNTYSFGFSSGAIYVVSLSSTGTLNWSRVISASFTNLSACCIIATSDGGYAIAGSYGNDLYIVKLNSSWNIQWTKTVNFSSNDVAYYLIQTSDGGYLVAGACGFGNDYDACIVKLNSSGTVQWKKAYGRSNVDHARRVFQTSDGGYIVAGYYSYSDTDKDFWLFKIDANGNLLWSRTYGSGGGEYGYSLTYTSTLDWVIAGERAGNSSISGIGGFDMLIMVIQQSDLSTCCSSAYNPSISVYNGSTEGSGGSISTVSSTNTIISPTNFSIGIVNTVCTTPVGISENDNLYCKDKITIKLNSEISGSVNIKIYDISGTLVFKGKALVKDQYIELDISKLKKGVYLLELNIDGKVIRKRFLKG